MHVEILQVADEGVALDAVQGPNVVFDLALIVRYLGVAGGLGALSGTRTRGRLPLLTDARLGRQREPGGRACLRIVDRGSWSSRLASCSPLKDL